MELMIYRLRRMIYNRVAVGDIHASRDWERTETGVLRRGRPPGRPAVLWRSEAPNYLSPSALMVAVYRLRLLGSARSLAALLATPKRLLTVLKWLPLSVGEAEVEWVSLPRSEAPNYLSP